MNEREVAALETGLGSRTEDVVIRMTPQEKQAFVIEAQGLGISLSAFVRLLLQNWTNKVTFEKQ